MKIAHFYNVLLVFFFGIAALMIVPHHEMWRDELQAWLIAKNSTSISELLANVKYEGSGVLWHLLIYPLTKVSLGPESMQYLHITISTLSVFVIARWAPFPITQKILLCLSYFIFYEYSLIARNYAIGTLLIFLFCALYPKRDIYPIRISFLLLLLFHSSIFGLIVGICLLATVIFEDYIINSSKKNKFNESFTVTKTLAMSIILIGFISAFLQIIPPSNGAFASEWSFYPNIDSAYRSYIALVSAYYPLPVFDINFWNNVFLVSNKLFVIVSLPIMILTFYIFLRFFSSRPSSLFFFVMSSFAITLFFYVKYGGYLRHHGFLFITLIAALWLYCDSKKSRLFQIPGIFKEIAISKVNKLIYLILAIHFMSSLIAVYKDYYLNFSSAREVAEFLKKSNLTNSEIIGHSSPAMSGISGYLDGKEIFFLEENRYGTFNKWDLKKMNEVNYSLIDSVAERLTNNNNKVLLN